MGAFMFDIDEATSMGAFMFDIDEATSMGAAAQR